MLASHFPGTPEHQRLLAGIATYYADDPRVLAVSVFGSLGRGSWDQHSDVDLDVVLADGLQPPVVEEVRRLCAAIGEPLAVLVPDGDDAANAVLCSLMPFSIRYHALATTKPQIVDSLLLLAGRIDVAAIRDAGLANQRTQPPAPEHLLGDCLHLLVGIDVALSRRQFWRAFALLGLARGNLVQLFASSRGAERPWHAFDTEASDALKASLGQTLPRADLDSLREAFASLIEVVGRDLVDLSAGRLRLTDAQQALLNHLRARAGGA